MTAPYPFAARSPRLPWVTYSTRGEPMQHCSVCDTWGAAYESLAEYEWDHLHHADPALAADVEAALHESWED
jgi:hypothetical protein